MKKIYNKHIWRFILMFWVKVFTGVAIGLVVIYLLAAFITLEFFNPIETFQLSTKNPGPILRIFLLGSIAITFVIYQNLPNNKTYDELIK